MTIAETYREQAAERRCQELADEASRKYGETIAYLKNLIAASEDWLDAIARAEGR